MTLLGSAYDPEDGFLSVDAPTPFDPIVWRSSIDGVIGYGYFHNVTQLSVGAHVISMEVDDGDGNTVIKSVSISVVP